jgi:hypothetical protein
MNINSFYNIPGVPLNKKEDFIIGMCVIPHGLEYILCDDCLEEDSVDSYVDAQKYGY